MRTYVTIQTRTAFVLFVCTALLLSGCKSATQPATQNAAAPTANSNATPAATASIPGTLEPTDETWTPEAMEDLLAPVALYPDKFLGEVLVASTNPQEVLDAGNWRVKNDNLEGKELDNAAREAGFTPPVRMIIQNPVVLDMMSSELGWTEELGQAFVNDQAGVLDAVQRLRVQARDAGNLENSDKMVVGTELQDGQQAIVLSSPDPNYVYVPQYNPETVYAPVEKSSGHSTGTVVAAAALGFLGGILVSKIFDHDDDDWYHDDYYAPRYHGAPMPYYPPYPYRPVYGGGYYNTTSYVRPPNYRYAYNDRTVVYRNVDNYWNRYDNVTYKTRATRTVVSPITRARPNRPELAKLNEQAKRGPRRKGPSKVERDAYQADQAQKRDARDRGGKGGKAAEDRGAGGGANRERAGGAGGEKRANRGGGADRERPKAGGGGGKQGGGKQGGGKQGGGKQGGGKKPRG